MGLSRAIAETEGFGVRGLLGDLALRLIIGSGVRGVKGGDSRTHSVVAEGVDGSEEIPRRSCAAGI